MLTRKTFQSIFNRRIPLSFSSFSSYSKLPLSSPISTFQSSQRKQQQPQFNISTSRDFVSTNKEKGFMTIGELIQSSIETVLVVFPDHLGRLMGKRYDKEYFVSSWREGGHACNYLLTVDIETRPRNGFSLANWELGYGDFHLEPDMSTLRLASWLDNTAIVHCDLNHSKTHAPVNPAPRSILKKQEEKAQSLGFITKAATELEYYCYKDSYEQANKKGYSNLNPVGWYAEDYHILQATREEPLNAEVRKHLKKSGIFVETSKGETGIGQHELNIKYANALTMADNHTIYKQCMKDVAGKIGWSVTFMARPCEKDAGSSCHIHLSLWDKDNQNVFDGQNKIGPDILCSDYFRWFLGGWIKHTNEMMIFYAPTVNSYKRYEDGSWAPTKIAWSSDNRTAGFRVVGSGKSLRIECRIPGADCNPYLALAASIASGIDGIEKKIEPPKIFEGDIYQAGSLPRVPRTLKDALQHFKSSEFAVRHFGRDVVEHYAHHTQLEIDAFDSSVTDWERKRYFEQI